MPLTALRDPSTKRHRVANNAWLKPYIWLNLHTTIGYSLPDIECSKDCAMLRNIIESARKRPGHRRRPKPKAKR